MEQLPSALPEEAAMESSRQRFLVAIRSMDAWLKPRYLNGQASIDEKHHIELSAGLSSNFIFGELGGRMFIACKKDILPWLSTIQWTKLSVPGFHDLKSRRIDLIFDGKESGGRITGKPLTSFMLSLNVDEITIIALRQHARMDFRLSENGGISKEAFSSVPIKLRKKISPPRPLPSANAYPSLSGRDLG